MPTITPLMKKDYVAEDFTLKSVGGKMTSLYEFLSGKDHHGFLIAFICNHCPYVKAILEKLTVDIKKLSVLNIPTIAICSNDDVLYPEDSFENMQKMSKANMFDFPYLHDRNQKVAQKYGAVCTPDFFGFNANKTLQYRGRFDSSGKSSSISTNRDLYNAMVEISRNGTYAGKQYPSLGCSIKWKD